MPELGSTERHSSSPSGSGPNSPGPRRRSFVTVRSSPRSAPECTTSSSLVAARLAANAEAKEVRGGGRDGSAAGAGFSLDSGTRDCPPSLRVDVEDDAALDDDMCFVEKAGFDGAPKLGLDGGAGRLEAGVFAGMSETGAHDLNIRLGLVGVLRTRIFVASFSRCRARTSALAMRSALRASSCAICASRSAVSRSAMR